MEWLKGGNMRSHFANMLDGELFIADAEIPFCALVSMPGDSNKRSRTMEADFEEVRQAVHVKLNSGLSLMFSI